MSLTAVPGVAVGHATDREARSGVTTVVFDQPAVCGVAVHGGAPGTRETDILRPGGLAPPVDALVLAGGSAFGLAAGDGVQRALADRGRGFTVGAHRIPIVPAAIVFDLSGPRPDYRALGERSVAAASREEVEEGSLGAGTNATTANLKGGVGSAVERAGPALVGALVVVNAFGSATAANGPWFRAAPFERNGEFGGLGTAAEADFAAVLTKHGRAGQSTVIAAVVTDAALSDAQATRLALSTHDGIALALWPAHTLFDGDTIFAAATGHAGPLASPADQVALAAAATRALARAIARAVYLASAAPGDSAPTWQNAFGRASPGVGRSERQPLPKD